MSSSISRSRGRSAFAIFTIVAGAIGWFASFELLTEYIKTLKEPGYVPNCSVSVLVTCGPNMDSWQGSVLGFSNTIIGVAAFTIPIVLGVAMLAGAAFPRWFWNLYQLGLLGGFVLVCWLQAQSLYDLRTLCPWCMVVWIVMIPLWWISLAWPFGSGEIALGERWRKLAASIASWTWVVIFFNILIVAVLAQIELNWFAEFTRG